MSSNDEPEKITISQMSRVGWFDTRQLFHTGLKVVASTVIGSMTARRELVAALDPAAQLPAADYANERELWIDYIADTGDGWDATFSIAWLVGRDRLWLRSDCAATAQPIPQTQSEAPSSGSSDDALELPAGKLLVLGGDQVYPVATADDYQGRFVDPFQCARWRQERGRDVFAIPGNHDWYDGLTAFLRIFCQPERWIGCWEAEQRRSYFAIKLPHGWWLWAADAALEDDLDTPQREYFERAGKLVAAGEKIILVVPNPTWALSPEALATNLSESKSATVFDKIFRLAENGGNGDRVAAVISGDLHHYARHETDGAGAKIQYVTCGGGGAFTLGTREQPKTFTYPENRHAELKSAYPSDVESNAMRWGALRFPIDSRGFSFILATLLILGVWFLHVSSTWLNAVPTENLGGAKIEPLLKLLVSEEIGLESAWSVVVNIFDTLIHAPLEVIYTLLFAAGVVAFANSGKNRRLSPWVWRLAGALHGAAQFAVALLVVWLVARGFAKLGATASDAPNFWILVLSGLLMIPFNGFLFGAYLLISNIAAGMHEQEVFSCQSRTDFKSFLRIHVAAEAVTIYPVGLRRPGGKWKTAPGVIGEAPQLRMPYLWYSQALKFPKKGIERLYDPETPLQPQLIEPPIVVPKRGGLIA